MCHEKVGLKRVIHILEVLVRKKEVKIFGFFNYAREKNLPLTKKLLQKDPP